MKPANVGDVSKVVQVLSDFYIREGPERVLFAIRSGGHASSGASSNIHGGVTVDLSHFDQIHVSNDESSTTVGTGARWAAVYDKLDRLGLAVVGGRNADVGVGGLLLGGATSASLFPAMNSKLM